ncbi:hypothetical protein AL538_00150 [Vibrio harveyi]|uniref:Fimbrial protein n=1 Tax=Vibrio harveyi TaxID=669 RepID=A0ABM5XT56_VIBHA|nr:CfaE/CblD family pilus tip adhesin [Vibrio harveyi]AMF96244.2 hypothetical protein AL538_00150 [Vibrio harveyi]
MKFMVRVFCIFIALNNSALANWGDDVIINRSDSMDISNIKPMIIKDLYWVSDHGIHTYFTCLSPDVCPINQGKWGAIGKTPVNVTFRSYQGLVRHLTLMGGHYSYGCSSKTAYLNSPTGCNSNGVYLVFDLSENEISKLEFGSVWKMDELALNICKWNISCEGFGKVIINITINMTDKNNAQIYIPSSGSSTANVNLKLETYNSQYLKGEQSIGICVYDGHDSTRGSLFDMSMTGTINSKNEFAIVHDNGDEIPIDMFVTFPDGGGNIIRPSRSFSYSTKGHDSVAMGLPGVDTPVYCIPMDINFKVSPFLKNNKSSGVYNGSFNLKFNATLY